MSKSNQFAFAQILRHLKPDRVLILGKTNWKFLPSQATDGFSKIIQAQEDKKMKLANAMGPLERDESYCCWYRVSNSPWALIGAVKHPSSYGFKVSEWQEWIAQFMDNWPVPTY